MSGTMPYSGNQTSDYCFRKQAIPEPEMRLVILGRTGSGKSATANSIIGKQEFISRSSASSITERCMRATNFRFGHTLTIVDTPGLFDTKYSHQNVSTEILRCIHLSDPGPHAFLLVVKIDRFTSQDKETFDRFFEIFGEELGNYSIIIFTRLDDLEDGNSNIETFIGESGNELKELLSKCGKRYIAINNNGSRIEKLIKVSEIIRNVDIIRQLNRDRHYTNDMYKQAQGSFQKRLKEIEMETELEKKRENDRIVSRYRSALEQRKLLNEKLERDVTSTCLKTEEIYSKQVKLQKSFEEKKSNLDKLRKHHAKQIYLSKVEFENQQKLVQDRGRNLDTRIENTQRQFRRQQEKDRQLLNEIAAKNREELSAYEATCKNKLESLSKKEEPDDLAEVLAGRFARWLVEDVIIGGLERKLNKRNENVERDYKQQNRQTTDKEECTIL